MAGSTLNAAAAAFVSRKPDYEPASALPAVEVLDDTCHLEVVDECLLEAILSHLPRATVERCILTAFRHQNLTYAYMMKRL